MDRNWMIVQAAMQEIIDGHYVYEPNKNDAPWKDNTSLRPLRGQAINCRAASYLLRAIALARGAAPASLQIVKYTAEPVTVSGKQQAGDFLAVCSPSFNVLGRTLHRINTPGLHGWVFDNHYRLRCDNKVFDPLFGTSGWLNPPLIKLTSTEGDDQVFGEKYCVKTVLAMQGKTPTLDFAVEIVPDRSVDGRYVITDGDFRIET